jgi:hypothetical protein
MVDYLQKPIAESKRVPASSTRGMTRAGYTTRAGAPTQWMIRLKGEKIWRRVMVWQFSNAGTAFVRIGGKPYVITENLSIYETRKATGPAWR